MRIKAFGATAFVLAIAGCGGPTQAVVSADEAKIHLGDDWFVFRAEGLSISVDEARARDAAMSEDAPPEGIWDAQLAKESASLWLQNCAPCHGVKGDLEGAPQFDPPAREWGTFGTTMGFFFGGDKMRAGIYRSIRDGKGQMPSWGKRFSREQIWGLVNHLEGF
ncbi:MAG: cytochrome c [Myxococcota bacterium]